MILQTDNFHKVGVLMSCDARFRHQNAKWRLKWLILPFMHQREVQEGSLTKGWGLLDMVEKIVLATVKAILDGENEVILGWVLESPNKQEPKIRYLRYIDAQPDFEGQPAAATGRDYGGGSCEEEKRAAATIVTTSTVPPKVAKKFKKASPSKKDSVPVPAYKEPIQKGKRVKRSAKKSSTTPTTGIIIRDPLVETQLQRKEKVDVARGKGIDLLSKVALTEESQMKEVRKKSLRDFHKSHPSGSGSVAKNHQAVLGNDKDDSNNQEGSEQENDSEEHESNSEQDTDGSESDSESDQQVYDDDEEDDEDDDDKSEGDKDRGMDSDDIQDKKADVRMIDAQQEKETLEITQEQVVEDAHVTMTGEFSTL
uniref:Uncharacterized protein n=1 Tax=Tanacetum cinerariifolium TaxID=118510 RepID=A0A6L2NCF2_TANCI|nr:hypothetical protein [Tanacetum cinerariifolium]